MSSPNITVISARLPHIAVLETTSKHIVLDSLIHIDAHGHLERERPTEGYGFVLDWRALRAAAYHRSHRMALIYGWIYVAALERVYGQAQWVLDEERAWKESTALMPNGYVDTFHATH